MCYTCGTMSDKSSHRTQIIVALITLVGVLGAAAIANWDKIVPSEQQGAQEQTGAATTTRPAPQPDLPVAAAPAGPSLETIRSNVDIRAARLPEIVDRLADGTPRRHYSVWIEAPRDVMRQIASVRYHYPDKLFVTPRTESTDRSSGFKDVYLGTGAVYTMDVTLVLRSGEEIAFDFNMHRTLFGD